MYDLIRGPRITILTPIDGENLSKSLVPIKGAVRNATSVTLNGRNLLIDEEGNLNELVLVNYGYGIFEFKAKDRLGREESKTIQYIYQ